MKVIRIGSSRLPTMTIAISDLQDPDGNKVDLSNCNPKDLVFDGRPNGGDSHGMKFGVEIIRETITFTRIDKNYGNRNQGWYDAMHFRMYNKSEEEVPEFGSLYTYLGVRWERAPYEIIEAYIHPSVKTIKEGAFNACNKMTKCVMEDTVEDIKKYAFCNCESLRTLRLSQILNHIGEFAFEHCEALDIIVLPSTVSYIHFRAYQACVHMKVLALPDSIDLDDIGDNIIYNCRKLQVAKPNNMTYKEWLQQRFQNLPLHTVCYNANVTSKDILQCIQQHPRSPTQRDDAGMTALHIVSMLARAGHREVQKVFYTLYEANRAALIVQDMYGTTPLDYLCQQEDNMGLLVTLIPDLCVNR